MPNHIDTAATEPYSTNDGPPSSATTNVSPSSKDAITDATPATPADGANEQCVEAAAADVAPNVAERIAKKFKELSEVIKSCTAPSVLSDKWVFLRKHVDRLRIDMSPMEFVEVLKEEYSVDALTFLKLYERVGDQLRPASWLNDAAHLYVVIDAEKYAVSFSRDEQFLFPMTHTALDYALERLPPDTTQAPTTVFVVDSQDSVEVMQWLGLRAVTGEGLEALTCQDVEGLFAGDQRSDFSWRYYLLLVDFDVTRLENRPLGTVASTINRLADAEEVYRINPSRRFGVCRPTAQEFRLLERVTTFKDTVQVRAVFEKWSAAISSVSVNSWRTHFNLEKLSLSAARAALTHALRRSDAVVHRMEVSGALRAYSAAGKEVVMHKLYEDIDRTSDPFDQVDLIAAAGYAETFLDSDPLVRAAEAVLAGQSPPSDHELQAELFDQRQRCIVELRRICRDRKAKRRAS